MIMDILLFILNIFLKLGAILLPSWGIPETYFSAFDTIEVGLKYINGIIPIDVIFNCILFLFSFVVIKLLVKLAIGILSIIRGGGNIDI